MPDASAPSVCFPEKYRPERARVHVRNELDMAADIDRVWAWLISAPLWPDWYSNAAEVHILDGPTEILGANSQFRWRTFGVKISSTVIDWEPPYRIGWDGKAIGIDVFHGWVLRPSAKGCHVCTEETQLGWLAWLSHTVMPSRMGKYHQDWLEQLQAQAQSGWPTTAR